MQRQRTRVKNKKKKKQEGKTKNPWVHLLDLFEHPFYVLQGNKLFTRVYDGMEGRETIMKLFSFFVSFYGCLLFTRSLCPRKSALSLDSCLTIRKKERERKSKAMKECCVRARSSESVSQQYTFSLGWALNPSNPLSWGITHTFPQLFRQRDRRSRNGQSPVMNSSLEQPIKRDARVRARDRQVLMIRVKNSSESSWGQRRLLSPPSLEGEGVLNGFRQQFF